VCASVCFPLRQNTRCARPPTGVQAAAGRGRGGAGRHAAAARGAPLPAAAGGVGGVQGMWTAAQASVYPVLLAIQLGPTASQNPPNLSRCTAVHQPPPQKGRPPGHGAGRGRRLRGGRRLHRPQHPPDRIGRCQHRRAHLRPRQPLGRRGARRARRRGARRQAAAAARPLPALRGGGRGVAGGGGRCRGRRSRGRQRRSGLERSGRHRGQCSGGGQHGAGQQQRGRGGQRQR
jgi:hypothetical protein